MPDTIGSSPATSVARQGNSAGSAPSRWAAQALEIKVGLRISGRGRRSVRTPRKSRVLLTHGERRCNIARPAEMPQIAPRFGHPATSMLSHHPRHSETEASHVALTAAGRRPQAEASIRGDIMRVLTSMIAISALLLLAACEGRQGSTGPGRSAGRRRTAGPDRRAGSRRTARPRRRAGQGRRARPRRPAGRAWRGRTGRTCRQARTARRARAAGRARTGRQQAAAQPRRAAPRRGHRQARLQQRRGPGVCGLPGYRRRGPATGRRRHLRGRRHRNLHAQVAARRPPDRARSTQRAPPSPAHSLPRRRACS